MKNTPLTRRSFKLQIKNKIIETFQGMRPWIRKSKTSSSLIGYQSAAPSPWITEYVRDPCKNGAEVSLKKLLKKIYQQNQLLLAEGALGGRFIVLSTAIATQIHINMLIELLIAESKTALSLKQVRLIKGFGYMSIILSAVSFIVPCIILTINYIGL